jgi:Tol biopolymer transport system component
VWPDGRTIVYSGVSASGEYGLWRVGFDPDGGAAAGEAERMAGAAVGTARHLATTGNDKRLAYAGLLMASNLWSVAVDSEGEPTEAPAELTHETGRNTRPAFSADGRRIAFERWQPGTNPDVWMMEADGASARPLTTHAGVDAIATWTPDNRRVVFLSDRDGERAIWAVDVATGREQIFLRLDQDLEFPRLSPDGARVAFTSKHASDTVNVWVVGTDGSAPRQLSFDRESASYACWSPDGRMLAAQVRRGENSHVVVLPASGGELRQLTDEPGQSWAYSWSPDGSRIAFAGFREGFWNVWWVSLDGQRQSNLTRLTRPNVYLRYPAWAPGGDRVVFEYAETTGNIWLLETVSDER